MGMRRKRIERSRRRYREGGPLKLEFCHGILQVRFHRRRCRLQDILAVRNEDGGLHVRSTLRQECSKARIYPSIVLTPTS